MLAGFEGGSRGRIWRADVDIVDWLRGLGLERYEQTFRDNEIDPEVLLDLSEADLQALGLPLGPRKTMQKAIAALRQGTSRSDVPTAAEREPRDRVYRAAERRQLTVMFCDLVGSTALSSRLDPEDLREVIGAYHTCVAETVSRFEGVVAKYMGDGVLVYFGYPQAHEDDAERAVRAGLAIVDAVGQLQAMEPLQVRVGVATGLVVVGDLIGEGVAQEQAVIGETPNLAARLQTGAEPDTVVIAHNTRRLVGNLFDCHDLGPVHIKGLAAPARAWQVLGTSRIESRFEAFHGTAGSLMPVVGRVEEVELLLRRWMRARVGEGQVVLLSGEPGIGKSRIVAALRERITCEPHVCLRYFCSPHHTDSAFFPIISQLGHAAGFDRDDAADTKLTKLETLLSRWSAPREDTTLLAELLSLSIDGRYPPLSLTPKQQRERTLAALVRQLEGSARHSPVLILFEDAHWIDPTSLDALTLAVKQVQHLRVLLVITFRTEFRPPWGDQAHVTPLTLGRLEAREGVALAGLVANGKALPPEILEQIVTRTDGVPLFVEELTKTVLESGLLREEDQRYVLDGPLPTLAIPTSLNASLLARLDRLPPSVREVAQIGAAIGRDFSYERLAAVVPLLEIPLRQALERLATAELIIARGTPPEAMYMFKHALVQDAAYSTLLRERRQQLHARIASVLEEKFPDAAETQPELLAHHCTQAGLTATAVDYGYRAGQLAIRRSAMTEAVAHFSRALGLLMHLPENADRDRREFRLQLAHAGALEHSSGWASPQMGQAYSRAYELSQVVDDISELELFSALNGLRQFRLNRAELAAAHELANDLRRLGEVRPTTAALELARRALGTILMFQGDFDPALEHFSLVLDRYDPAIHESAAFFGQPNVGVAALSFTAWILLFQGHFAAALQQSSQALERARDLSNPYHSAFSFHANCLFNQVCQDWRIVQERSTSLVSLAAEQGFPHLHATGTFFRGWAVFSSGEVDTGIAQMRQGLAAKRAGGAEIKVPYYLGVLADAYTQVGRAADALPLLIDALDRVERTGERWFEAELYRLKAEVLIALGPPLDAAVEAEASLRQALAVARAQGARLWELRASVNLARLWREQGRRAEARGLLTPICGWFAEAIAPPDLHAAGAVLDSLN
jgi:class 3 adenylate cyclase/predicted ATPase